MWDIGFAAQNGCVVLLVVSYNTHIPRSPTTQLTEQKIPVSALSKGEEWKKFLAKFISSASANPLVCWYYYDAIHCWCFSSILCTGWRDAMVGIRRVMVEQQRRLSKGWWFCCLFDGSIPHQTTAFLLFLLCCPTNAMVILLRLRIIFPCALLLQQRSHSPGACSAGDH